MDFCVDSVGIFLFLNSHYKKTVEYRRIVKPRRERSRMRWNNCMKRDLGRAIVNIPQWVAIADERNNGNLWKELLIKVEEATE